MKKILIATDTFYPKKDGVVRFLEEIVPELKHKYKITILAPSFSDKFVYEKKLGVDVIRFPVGRVKVENYSGVRLYYKKIKAIVRDHDIVWSHSIAPLGAMAMTAAKKLKKHLVAFTHAIEWEQLSHILVESKRTKKVLLPILKKFGRYLYNKCDILMVPSKNIAEQLKQEGITPKKIIVHLGVNYDEFIPTKNIEESKKKLRIKPDKIIIGYCGRISKEKNLVTLCTVFKKLKQKYPNLYLLIVGDGNRNEIDVEEDYKITGFVNDVVPYLQAMDIFVLPSLTETSSLATLEAMSCALPVVTTPVGHIRDYIINNKNGYTFPPENTFILTKKLERLIEKSQLRKAIGIMARKTVTTKYFWEKTITKIDRVLSKL